MSKVDGGAAGRKPLELPSLNQKNGESGAISVAGERGLFLVNPYPVVMRTAAATVIKRPMTEPQSYSPDARARDELAAKKMKMAAAAASARKNAATEAAAKQRILDESAVRIAKAHEFLANKEKALAEKEAKKVAAAAAKKKALAEETAKKKAATVAAAAARKKAAEEETSKKKAAAAATLEAKKKADIEAAELAAAATTASVALIAAEGERAAEQVLHHSEMDDEIVNATSIQSEETTKKSAMIESKEDARKEKLRNAMKRGSVGVPTGGDIRQAIKSDSFPDALLLKLAQMSIFDLKVMLKGQRIDLLLERLESLVPPEDPSARSAFVYFHAACLAKKAADKENQDYDGFKHLDPLTDEYVKELTSMRDEYCISIVPELRVDIIEIALRLFEGGKTGKSDGRKFVQEFLKNILYHALPPHMYNGIYVSQKKHKGFLLNDNQLEKINEICRRFFNVHSITSEGTSDRIRFRKRSRFDITFRRFLSRAAESIREGKVKKCNWIPDCTFDEENLPYLKKPEYKYFDEEEMQLEEEGEVEMNIDLNGNEDEVLSEGELSDRESD